MEPIFHIIGKNEWQKAKAAGRYAPESLQREGFIHCSTASTLVGAANRFYRGQGNLVILCLNPDLVVSEIKYERGSDGVEGPFPHIYGTLNIDAVFDVVELSCRTDGTFDLPDQLMR